MNTRPVAASDPPNDSSGSTGACLMLSVSGARGIVGETMTPKVTRRFGGAFAGWVRATTGAAAPVVCIGRDSRPSGPALMAAAIEGISHAGCRVIDLGCVTTPTVGVMISQHGAAGGMVVTASHNPGQWNGLKCLDSDGVAPAPRHADDIIRRFHDGAVEHGEPAAVAVDKTGTETHVDRVLTAIDTELVRASGFRVVLDSVNGAGGPAGRRLLEALGCTVIHINAEPDGRFTHPPEPVREHLGELMDRTRAEGAAVGFAQDPDADRLAVVDDQGRFIGEEYTLVLAAMRVLSGTDGGVAVANLSTSRMIDDLALRRGGVSVLRTPVGEANVVAAMKTADAAIGGEGNGGVIFPPVCWVRDSLSSMALVLELLASEGRPLSAIIGELPRYAMIKDKFDLATAGGRDAIAPMLERVAARFAGARIDRSDGIRVDLDDGWVHLRPSNTEPIVRIIAEAESEARAKELVGEIRSVVRS